MARKDGYATPAKAARVRAPRAKKPKSYLSSVMFSRDDVEGKDAATDNMDYITPICIDRVSDGDTVAVYTFAGIKKVTKVVTFTDTEK